MPLPQQHRVALTVPGTVGSVTVQTWGEQDAGGPLLLLAHGAGSRVDHPVHRGVASAVAAAGHTVVAFNFAYTEAGRRAPDPADRLRSCYRDVAAWAGERFPGRPLIGGGRSMGGRMASLLAAEGYPFAGLVLLNYPLVASRSRTTGTPRTAHWPQIEVPVLFVHGSRDPLFPSERFAAARSLLRPDVAVHVIDGADHAFAVPKRAQRSAVEIYAEVAAAVSGWLTAVQAHA